MFEPIVHEFEVKGDKFVFRKPTVRDNIQIISRRQQIMMLGNINPMTISFEEDGLFYDIARLDICLSEAPSHWFAIEKTKDKEGKDQEQRRVSVGQANVDTEQFQEVREEVYRFLKTFSGGPRPQEPDKQSE